MGSPIELRAITGKTREFAKSSPKDKFLKELKCYASPNIRDQVVDLLVYWSKRLELPTILFILWLGISRSKFYQWRSRYRQDNHHNGDIPRDYWLQDSEKQAIINFYQEHPNEGYRRLTFMMIDADVVAVSPSSVWRILSEAGLLRRWNRKPSLKGTGFIQPLLPHQHWHVDISYINICGTFYYLLKFCK